ncbi:MAG: cation:proton antiporter [Anaerolineae bacterium]|nr:cation:proton antiporter [Anaerolineae bacterium]MCA9887955.1 cation:proton antiporter [Anaerolineae bacterium]MCA9892880.1 cation:proton antiporter [Anaerolineae bacterium]MCB9461854.1 cation:proton antiporter [Anaerolineaceae bacterium]
MNSPLVSDILNLALIVMVLLLPLTFVRVLIGNKEHKARRSADRLLAVDLMTTLLVGIIVLLALFEESPKTIDLGIALTALAFAGTLATARYISEGRVF